MASGCLVVTSNLGALPETTAGFGFLMEPENELIPFARKYSKLVISTINDARKTPIDFAERREKQKAFANSNYIWGTRAREWEQWLLMTVF